MSDIPENLPESSKTAKVARGALQVAGSVPFAGGLFSAIAGAWSERDQEEANKFFDYWIKMLHDEIKEKEITMIEILARVNLQDEEIKKRVNSKDFQSLVKKTFREWSGAESEEKRKYIRNILSNAAVTSLTSDDVLKLFIDWINTYSELHFQVIAAVYNSNGIGRGDIWKKIGKGQVREDSAEADLYKLLFRDLTMGSIIRQHRAVDFHGNFIAKTPAKRRPKGSGPKPTKSAFDNEDKYELTGLGNQFIHYAMSDLPIRLKYENPLSDK